MRLIKQTTLALSACLFISSQVFAGEVALPNTFSANTPAIADEVNANFTAVKTAVDDNNVQIGNTISLVQKKGLIDYQLSRATNISYNQEVTNTFINIGTLYTFTKTEDDSVVEVQFDGYLKAVITAGSGAAFQIRIDDNPASSLIYMPIKGTGTLEAYRSQSLIFPSLNTGTHTVSMWARCVSGTCSSVTVNSGGWGGSLLIKELN